MKVEASGAHKVYFEGSGFVETPIFEMANLPPLCSIQGPALLIDHMTSILVEPECTAHLSEEKNVRIDVSQMSDSTHLLTEKSDPIQLAIFSHRLD